MSDQFSVSRQAIREALKVLAAKGLVTSRRRAGTSVTPRREWHLFDPDVLAWHPPLGLQSKFLNDIVEIRQIIEPAAAYYAAERGEADKIAEITGALEAMRRNKGDTDALIASDIAFHLAIFAASGNGLIDRLSTVLGPLFRASFRIHSETAPVREEIIESHAAVHDAIVDRDPARAAAAMASMLARVTDEIARLRFAQDRTRN